MVNYMLLFFKCEHTLQCSCTARITVGVNEERTVGVNEERTVGVNEERTVGVNEERTVGVNEERTVGVNEERTVGVNEERTVGVNEERTVGVNEERTVGVNEERTVGVNEERTVGVNEERTVGVNEERTVGVNEERMAAVNEERMAGEHRSYHDAITGDEAERRLEQHGGHCYLTRYSQIRGCYVLSVYKQHRLTSAVKDHYEIVIESRKKYRIKGKTKTFDSIQSLLGYYEQNRIDPTLRSIGLAYTEDEYEQAQEAERQGKDKIVTEKEEEGTQRNKKCIMQ